MRDQVAYRGTFPCSLAVLLVARLGSSTFEAVSVYPRPFLSLRWREGKSGNIEVIGA